MICLRIARLLLGFVVISSPSVHRCVAADGNEKHPASVSLGDDPATAMRKLSVAPGLKVKPFATEPLIQDVVSFAFDQKGRAFVVETGRRRTSVYDIRKHRDWTDSDLSFRTVQDRIDFLKSRLVPENTKLPRDTIEDRNGDGQFDWRDLEVESERIKLVWDSTGDGRADKSVVFADGFNTLVSGVAAGVLVVGQDVYFACIPDLWRLRDTTGDDQADERARLHGGFGVHIAYGGHDMHGLKLGPDGKIYWTIADRGFGPPDDIRGPGFSNNFLKRILPDTGAVFRCNPDGSELEVIAVGLRNPQELAFDALGNLFTADNNADGGDKARWTHIVEGADYGWRYGWQHLPKLGAWNSEKLWELQPLNTAASILPPAAHIGHGPAGIAYYPGTGMPDRFKDMFFYADFPGGVRCFKTTPKGASYEVVNPGDILQNNSAGRMEGKLLWDLYPTDIDFAPGGGAYVLDWVQGWEKTGKGRLWHVGDAAVEGSAIVQEVKGLLAAGFMHRKEDELAGLLGHVDQRVRMGAQQALVDQARLVESKRNRLTRLVKTANKPLAALLDAARFGRTTEARLHALWAISQIHNIASGDQLQEIVRLTLDKDSEVRAASAGVIGRTGFKPGGGALVTLLGDAEPRVRFAAAMAVSKLPSAQAVPTLVALLQANADRDAFLRHAGVLALAACADEGQLIALAGHANPSVRLAVLLCMRRTESPHIARFLADSDPLLVLEAARAINDLPIDAATGQLSALVMPPAHLRKIPSDDLTPMLRRAAHAAYRLGGASHATQLAALAMDASVPEAVRVETLEMLGDWEGAFGRDRITGLWRPVQPRSAEVARGALTKASGPLLDGKSPVPDGVRTAAIGVVQKLGLQENAPLLHALAASGSERTDVRIAALRALETFKDKALPDVLKTLSRDENETLRREARKIQARGGGEDALAALAETLHSGTRGEKQSALQSLGTFKGAGANAIIGEWLDKLLAGKAQKELTLDIIEAAASRNDGPLKERLEAYERKKDKADLLAGYRETLYGGDSKAGKEIFMERAEAGCLRCHKVNGVGGEVGPDLAGIGRTRTREYILESIIAPNAQIAPGFENLIVTTTDGATYAGMLKSETADTLAIQSPEDGLVTLKKSDIKARQKGLSSMLPELGTILTKRELRDLVEYLASLK